MQREWPDELAKPDRDDVAEMLDGFWRTLAELPDLLTRGEMLLCANLADTLRVAVRDMMLAMNGVAYPQGTRHLNAYLSESQRRALGKTLTLHTVDRDGWIGQCVALVVIYRWYAPQLMRAFGVEYPADVEDATWSLLVDKLPEWPRAVTTNSVEG